MAFFSHTLSPRDSSLTATDKTQPSFFARVIAALMVSRQRQADLEIARYLALSGGKLTDTAEREIEKLFLSGPRF